MTAHTVNIRAPRVGTALDWAFRRWPAMAPPAAGLLAASPPAETAEPVVALIGPPGSGKTTMFLTKGLVAGFNQPASPVDGRRRFGFLVTHVDYRQLWRGPIKSWWKIAPRELGTWQGGEDQPASHHITITCPDRHKLDFSVHFLAYGHEPGSIEKVFRGTEFSIPFLNEADLHPPEALFWATQRAGRYPEAQHGFPWWYGMFLDANSPLESNWLAQKMQRQWREGVEYRRQPPAVLPDGLGGWMVNPNAENIENLPPGYYEKQLKASPDWMIRRLLALEFGHDRSGLPVYLNDFIDQKHVAKQPLEPVAGLPLTIGFDAGGAPAAAICQDMPNGQFRVIAEVPAEQGTGPRRFAEMVNRALAQPPFAGRWKRANIIAGCDPSATLGGDKKTGEDIWHLEVAGYTGIDIRPAGGLDNKVHPRVDSLRKMMARDIDGRTPGFLLSPACVVIREGLNGRFRYRQKNKPGEPEYDLEKWEKSWHANVVEALQYAALTARGADGHGAERRYRTLPATIETEADAPGWGSARGQAYRGEVLT